jgi:hypothetical protein
LVDEVGLDIRREILGHERFLEEDFPDFSCWSLDRHSSDILLVEEEAVIECEASLFLSRLALWLWLIGGLLEGLLVLQRRAFIVHFEELIRLYFVILDLRKWEVVAVDIINDIDILITQVVVVVVVIFGIRFWLCF